MGNPFLLQACLRINRKEISNKLEIGKEYKFKKKNHRLYQINIPMDLRDENWNALGRCIIIEYTVGKERTEGIYIMVKIFGEKQAKYVTESFVSDEEVNSILKK
jgi:hypothetical protein